MSIPRAKDKPLFTPGPLTTSQTVKQAMLYDLGAHDADFIAVIAEIRERLLEVANVSTADGYEVVLMQGSGSFSIEAVISSAIPPERKILVIVNGAYGKRIVAMSQRYGIDTVVLAYPENEWPKLDEIESTIAADEAIAMVVVVHLETASGILNPIDEIGQIAHRYGRQYFVDSMSAFGAMPLDIPASHIDYLVSSANKCIEGVPGFAFVICRRDALLASEGWARTLSLDLLAQWQDMQANGQFRYTPAIQTMLAFRQALHELEDEGGVPARTARYRNNYKTLVTGMRKIGFREYVPVELQGHIITSFCYPDDPRFDFATFYEALKEQGQVIYSGKVTNVNCFRIGNIGRLFADDMNTLLSAIERVLADMGVKMPGG